MAPDAPLRRQPKAQYPLTRVPRGRPYAQYSVSPRSVCNHTDHKTCPKRLFCLHGPHVITQSKRRAHERLTLCRLVLRQEKEKTRSTARTCWRYSTRPSEKTTTHLTLKTRVQFTPLQQQSAQEGLSRSVRLTPAVEDPVSPHTSTLRNASATPALDSVFLWTWRPRYS